jgi:hypothetical protein
MIRAIAFAACIATAAAAQTAGSAPAGQNDTPAVAPAAQPTPAAQPATAAPAAQPASAASPEGRAQIDAVVAFLKAWGKGQWDAARPVAADQVKVRAGAQTATLDVAAGKGEAKPVLPFRGLSVVRENGIPTGVDVSELAIRIGEAETRGKAHVATEDRAGQVRVTAVTIE